MEKDFNIGDHVWARTEEDDCHPEWGKGLIISIDEDDIYLPYEIRFSDDQSIFWCDEKHICLTDPTEKVATTNKNTEHIHIKTDQEEIEALVMNRKPIDDVRPFQRGDYVIIPGHQMRIVTEIVNGRIETRNPITRNYDGSGWHRKDIKHATEEEIELFLYYSPEEMKLRDQIMIEMIKGAKLDSYNVNNAYKAADKIMKQRRRLH